MAGLAQIGGITPQVSLLLPPVVPQGQIVCTLCSCTVTVLYTIQLVLKLSSFKTALLNFEDDFF